MSKFRKLLIGTALATLPAAASLAQTAAPPAPAPAEAPAPASAPAPAADAAARPAADATTPAAGGEWDGKSGLGPISDHSADLPQPEGGKWGIGRDATPEEIAAWDVNVLPNGDGLPEGQGSAADGEMLFSDNCASCHGEFAEGVDNWPELAGGDGTLADADPVKTVGSYWPYLSTAWDYVHRSMPYGSAQTLSVDDTYAIIAYILYSNFLVEDDFVLSNENFLEVAMPNADGFIVDDRDSVELPGFQQDPCMENCKETVEITAKAANLDVTPGDATEGETEGTPMEGGGAAPTADAPATDGAEPVAPADTEGGESGAPKEVPSETQDAAATAAAEAVTAETASPDATQQPQGEAATPEAAPAPAADPAVAPAPEAAPAPAPTN